MSNKNERYPADQATRQPAALDRRRTSTPHSLCDNPRRTGPSRLFSVPKRSGSPSHCGILLLLPSLTLPLILTEPLFSCVPVNDTAAAHYDARLRLNMVLDEIGSPGPGREHVCKVLLQPGYIGELGGARGDLPQGPE